MSTKMTEELYFENVGGSDTAVAFHHSDPRTRRRAVVMAHGFHGSKVGGSRRFVDLARQLALRGVSTLRFDQPGSGDSAGSFEEASFNTWIATIEHFGRKLGSDGFEVALLGESMGATATMAAAENLGGSIRGIALWSPDPLLNKGSPAPDDGWMEEAGQRVRWTYWREAMSFDFVDAYLKLAVPACMVFGTADHLIPVESMRKVQALEKPGDHIRVIDGLPHSAWPVTQGAEILRETGDFLLAVLDQPK